jgi:hypothetical protein
MMRAMERSLGLSKKPEVPSVRTLPRELLDHVSRHISVISHGNFLSAFGQEPWESDRSRILLWTSIFKSDKWVQNMVKEHNAQPVLIGSHLHELPSETYIILYLCNPRKNNSDIQIPAESWKLFRECLCNHSVLPEGDIVLVSGIILNIQSVLLSCKSSSVSLPRHRQHKITRLPEGMPVLQYSIYETSHIQILNAIDIDTSYVSIEEQTFCWTFTLSGKDKGLSVDCWNLQNPDLSTIQQILAAVAYNDKLEPLDDHYIEETPSFISQIRS